MINIAEGRWIADGSIRTVVKRKMLAMDAANTNLARDNLAAV
jgi:hypothetical protein